MLRANLLPLSLSKFKKFLSKSLESKRKKIRRNYELHSDRIEQNAFNFFFPQSQNNFKHVSLHLLIYTKARFILIGFFTKCVITSYDKHSTHFSSAGTVLQRKERSIATPNPQTGPLCQLAGSSQISALQELFLPTEDCVCYSVRAISS